MTEAKNLTCGVCKDLFRNPYQLPCGHSFCRRPCLLRTPSSDFGSCPYCHIEVHVSLLEQNGELEERVQNYLAKRRSSGSRRVTCQFCRNLFDHCTVCPHCDQQLCNLCLKEHVDEFQGRLRRRCQSLRDAVGPLRKTREVLASSPNSEDRSRELSKRVDAATVALKSACANSFSRAETQLDQIEAQSKDKPSALLGKRNLVELADNLLRTVDSPMQHKAVVKLCEVRETAQNAVETLAALAESEFTFEHPAFRNLSVADNVRSLAVQLGNMSLLVDGRSPEAETDKKVNIDINLSKAGGACAPGSVAKSSEKSLSN
ncbi:hypothetical protein SprV_0200962700 [Sparganum proliferum]